MSYARKFGDEHDKKLMDTVTKSRIDAGKTASKRLFKKIAEGAGDLIGNKIADKITSLGKRKSKKRRWKTRNLHTTRKKTANYWWLKIILTPYKIGIPKSYKLARHNDWQCT